MVTGRRLVAGVAVAAVLGALPASTAALGQAAPVQHSPAGYRVHYGVGRRLCPTTRGQDTCFAIGRVSVKKGARGARPYIVPVDGVRSGPEATIGPAGGLTPYDFATAYGLHTDGTVADQTVAIVDAFNDPNLNSDLQTFDAHYSLAACSTSNGCLKIVDQAGGTTLPQNDHSGWSVEETLDVETVHSVCQRCNIMLVEADSASTPNFDAAEDEAVKLGATEISNSWGQPESSVAPKSAAAFKHPGVVITASTGDDGYYGYDTFQGADEPNAPASYNTVVAVGGTSLYLGQTATRQSESVWNDNGTQDVWEQALSSSQGASGGGCSTLSAAPAWQTRLSVWPSTGCKAHRLDADISADADWLTGFDTYDTYACGSSCLAPGWNTIGGTSLSSPLIAAMFGLAGGSHGVAYPALTLYGHLGTSALYDVMSGGNGFCDGEGAAACGDPNTPGLLLDCDYGASPKTPAAGDRACDALAGYDGASGVGTPNGLGAFEKTGPSSKVAGPSSLSRQAEGVWKASWHDPFPGGKVVSFLWNWGDGTATTTTSLDSASHAYAAAGAYKVVVTLKDNYGQTGSTTYSVAVG
ncbi:MAG: S53 family peptidase [Acidimicrobiales bacterium]